MPSPNDPVVQPAEPAVPKRASFNDKFEAGLALLTVVLTFLCFLVFVFLSCGASKESKAFFNAEKSLANAEAKFAQISSSAAEKSVPGKLAAARKERDQYKKQVAAAKDAAEEAKDRRGSQKEIMMYILGVLSAILTTIFGYYFGSSKGSAVKTGTLSEIATKATQPSAAPVTTTETTSTSQTSTTKPSHPTGAG